MIKVDIVDGKTNKTFLIEKMKALACDSFACLAMKTLLKDNVHFPDELIGKDIKQIINDLMQNGVVDPDVNISDDKIRTLIENLIKIFRSAFSNLEEFERILLLDKLLSTVTYKNGILDYKLSYYECDNYIDNFLTIYRLAWEVIKVNFPLLSPVEE